MSDQPARYSDDANLPPEREHDTHEPEKPVGFVAIVSPDDVASITVNGETFTFDERGEPIGRVLSVNDDGTASIGIGLGDEWFLDGSASDEPIKPFAYATRADIEKQARIDRHARASLVVPPWFAEVLRDIKRASD